MSQTWSLPPESFFAAVLPILLAFHHGCDISVPMPRNQYQPAMTGYFNGRKALEGGIRCFDEWKA